VNNLEPVRMAALLAICQDIGVHGPAFALLADPAGDAILSCRLHPVGEDVAASQSVALREG
jgi:hypothetical protein